MRVIPKYLPVTEDKLFVGFSSGVDSVAVSHFLKFRYNKEITLLYYNHNLRKQNYDMQDKAEEYANEYGFKYVIGKRKKSNHNHEADLRKDRLKFFEQFGQVILCHHLNDAVESYLMNCFKGCPEYLPIKPISVINEKLILYRPFILEQKKKICNYVKDNGLEKYVEEDETNYDIRHQRNFIRHCILPLTYEREEINLETIVKKKYK